jgi:hypothetical protein
MNWLPCGCYDKLFVCLQQIYYLRKNFQKICLIEMEGKKSLAEKIAKNGEEVTSNLLPRKSRDDYHKELNDFNNWKQENYVSGVTSFMSKKELF